MEHDLSAAQDQDVDLICHICKRPLTEDGEVWCSAVHNLTLAGAACVHHYVMVSGGMRCKKCGHVMGQPERPGDAAASPSPQVVFGLDGPREILDACCGGRMWWWEKTHPLAIYMDVREAPRGSVGELTGRPEWNPNWSCEPTCKGDFRNMPFEDESFQLVVFDPPHVTREKQPPEGINGLKYGALHPETEQEDLRQGFAECWRVLRPGGTLVFKWGAGSIKRVEPHFPAVPIVGTRSPRGGQTRWFIFYKPLDAAELEAVA